MNQNIIKKGVNLKHYKVEIMKYSDKIDKELLEDLTDYTILAFVKYKNSLSLIPSYIIEEINEKYGKK